MQSYVIIVLVVPRYPYHCNLLVIDVIVMKYAVKLMVILIVVLLVASGSWIGGSGM